MSLTWNEFNQIMQENFIIGVITSYSIESGINKILNMLKRGRKDTLEKQLIICLDKAFQHLCELYVLECDLESRKNFFIEIIKEKNFFSKKTLRQILESTINLEIDESVLNSWLFCVKKVMAEENLDILEKYLDKGKSLSENDIKAYPRILTVKPFLPPEEYLDRKECYEILEKLYCSKKLVLVNGIGGIGKSTVCRNIFHILDKKKDRTLAWIIYNDKSLLEDLRKQLFFPKEGKNWEKRFIKFLQQDIEEDAVIFIDNLNVSEEEEVFLKDLANANCNIVCTSRIEKFLYYETVPISFLEEKDCVELFYKYYKLNYDYEKIKNIILKAGRHTLVIEILGKIGYAEDYTLQELEDELTEKGFDLGGLASVGADEDTLIGHLCKTFNVSKLNDEQKAILYCLAILPVQRIPKRLKNWLGLQNSHNINYLVKHAWFVIDESGYYMHPVIKEVVKRLLDAQWEIIYKLLNGLEKEISFKENPEFDDSMMMILFAETILTYLSGENDTLVSQTEYDISILYGQFGDYKNSLTHINKCIEIEENSKRKGDFLASAYDHKGYVYYYTYEDNKAEKCYLESYEIRRKLKNKMYLAKTASSLALLYQGMWSVRTDKEEEKAKELLKLSWQYQKEAIQIFEKIFNGKPHSKIASAYNSMAQLHNSMKNYEEAVFYYRKAENIRLQLDGLSFGDLSVTYYGMCNNYTDMAESAKVKIYQLHYLKMALLYIEKSIRIRVSEIRKGNQKLGVDDLMEKRKFLKEHIEDIRKIL